MPKSPKEMGEAIAKNLPAKTGRTFEQWVELTRRQGLASRKVQGRYLGLIRQIPASQRGKYTKIAKEKSREAAIKEMQSALGK